MIAPKRRRRRCKGVTKNKNRKRCDLGPHGVPVPEEFPYCNNHKWQAPDYETVLKSFSRPPIAVAAKKGDLAEVKRILEEDPFEENSSGIERNLESREN